MATFANIVINDGAATPAAHTFAVTSRLNNVLTWNDRSSGVAAGFKGITLSYRPATAQNANAKIVMKIVDPRLAVTSASSGSGVQPNPVQAYFASANLEFILPAASDALARSDILAYAANLLANAQVVDAIKNLNPPV